VKIVTWNLRCVWKDGDGVNAFIHRAGFIYDKIMQEKPEIIAFQEVVSNSLELLKRMLPEYEFFGVLRSAKYTGEGVYVAYLKEKFLFLGGESFWLSPTPYVAGSRFVNQSDCPRVCAYVKLVDRNTGEILNIFDLHLDHVSDEARRLGLELLFKYIEDRNKAIDKDKIVILGDFNALREDGVMQFAFGKEWLIDSTKDVGVTFHDFGRENYRQIDYILLSKALESRVQSVGTWRDEHNGIYLSDHYPVCVELTEKSC
jgi:endonuclease/exonuclease/phosphatase family metal-dependent hydrolase